MRRLLAVAALFLFVGAADAQPTPLGGGAADPPPETAPAAEEPVAAAGDDAAEEPEPELTAEELVAAALAGPPDAGSVVDGGQARRTGRKRKGPRKGMSAQKGEEEDSSYLPEFLGVCVLLGLWLLTRLQKRSQERAQAAARTPPPPSAPRRPEELGHAIFQAVREDNLDSFRRLFLKGPEAVRVLGEEEAKSYLEQRSLGKLRKALDQLSVRIPPEGVYAGTELFADGFCELVVDVGGEEPLRVPVGIVDELDGILRIREAGK